MEGKGSGKQHIYKHFQTRKRTSEGPIQQQSCGNRRSMEGKKIDLHLKVKEV